MIKKKKHSPWMIALLTLAGLAAAVVVWYIMITIVVPELRSTDGMPDRLGDSWGQINQEIERSEDWRQIVQDSRFSLGQFFVEYDNAQDPLGVHHGYVGATYPVIDGSTVMVPLGMEFARQHLGLDDTQASHMAEFSTTDAAYRALFDRQQEVYYPGIAQSDYRYSLSPRPLDLFLGTLYSDEELALAKRNDITPIAKPVCKDAFVFITHKDNPVERLTLEQVRGIFSGKITNWQDVGGADENIRAFQREAGSGSQTGMESLVMQGIPMADPEIVRIVRGMGMLVESVAEYENTPAGIGYTYKYYIDNLYKNPDIKILCIEGIAPTDENIINESYPLSVNYYGVIREGDENAPGGLFLDWILSEEGQACVEQAGYVPLGTVQDAPPETDSRYAPAPNGIVGVWARFAEGRFYGGFTFFADGTGYRWHNLEGGFKIMNYAVSGDSLSYTFINMDDEPSVVQESMVLENDALSLGALDYVRVKSIQPEGCGLYWITGLDGKTKYYPWTDLLDE